MHMRSQKKVSREVFMNDPIGVDKEGNKVTMEDKLKDEGYSIDEAVSLKLDVRHMLKKMKTALTDREKLILELRYGLLTGEEITQRETAGRLDISRSYVSRIEKRALSKLYREMKPLL
jgi:RNA polymerase sporulation-specific sigma factor